MLSFSTAFTHVSKNKASTSSKKLKKKHQSINRKIEAFLHAYDISPFNNMIVLKAYIFRQIFNISKYKASIFSEKLKKNIKKRRLTQIMPAIFSSQLLTC